MPHHSVSYAKLNPLDAATELRQCIHKYQALIPSSWEKANSNWAGKILQNETTPVVAGPLAPKDGSEMLRSLFGQKNRPESLTSVETYLDGRTDQDKQKFWFAIVRDPLAQFVDAYVEMATILRKTDECSFNVKTAE